MTAVDQKITQHENPNPAVADAPLAGGVQAIEIYAHNADQYFSWSYQEAKKVVLKVLNQLIPKETPAKKMNVVRWPRLHDIPYWGSGRNTAGNLEWQGTGTSGGQGVFYMQADAHLFGHEMGHTTNLVHFVAGNFAWKHHDLNFPDCYMSYGHTKGRLPKPVGAVATGATADQGWPAGNAIQFGPGLHPSVPCAKCCLKLRGWNDEVLPCAWRHPDLF
jgi:hypothetical protein